MFNFRVNVVLKIEDSLCLFAVSRTELKNKKPNKERIHLFLSIKYKNRNILKKK